MVHSANYCIIIALLTKTSKGQIKLVVIYLIISKKVAVNTIRITSSLIFSFCFNPQLKHRTIMTSTIMKTMPMMPQAIRHSSLQNPRPFPCKSVMTLPFPVMWKTSVRAKLGYFPSFISLIHTHNTNLQRFL